MTTLKKVLVFSEDLSSYPEICSGAKQLGNEIIAVIVGAKDDAKRVAQLGAKTYWFGEKANEKMIEDYTPALQEIIQSEKPSLVLLKGTRSGKLIAGRLGVSLRAGVIPDAISFQIDDDETLTLERLVFGGTAVRTEKASTEITIATVGSGVFEINSFDAVGEIIAVEDVKLDNRIVCKEVRPKEGEKVELGAAKRVVGIGRGLAKQEDLAMIEKLAEALGAEIACSRPIAEGEKWMAVGRYIGVSGAMIKPDIYFALGISGQVQHMVGVNGAKTIVAVNKDKNAPIFNYADYGIVGDLYKVIPELMQLTKK